MSNKTVIIHQQAVSLDSSQLIQSGGEGMVFGVEETAVKLYHHPQTSQAHKLRHLLTLPFPAGVLAPCALVEDVQGQVVGFQMPRLESQAQMVKQLGNPIYWQKQGVKTADVVYLLQQIHTTLQQLHHQGVVVGDLNDCNLFFSPASQPPLFWIDVDSYQVGKFPCPVAQQPFLDPLLYGVADFRVRPFFSELTDWYAYFVLLVKSLLQVHPYGGAHHSYKSLPARATTRISILAQDVTYPKNGRSLETLSDELLHHLHRFFDKGERYPLPASLLAQYAAELVTCAHCGLSYPAARRSCPGCKLAVPAVQVPGGVKKLLTVDGFIETVGLVANGRIWAIVSAGGGYKLVRLGIGGKLDEVPLFNGRSGYRFAVFAHYLVVHPGHGRQLLILDVSNNQAERVTLSETATFRDSAVFAATPHALYRIAGSWIMRGQVRDGLYVEDPIATAHRAQTQFFASPYQDFIAGYHRVFAEQHFFLLAGRGMGYDLPVPPLLPGEHVAETAVVFSPDSVAIYRLVGQNGRLQTQLHVYDLQGKMKQQTTETAEAFLPHCYPYTTAGSHLPTLPSPLLDEETNLLLHPQGILTWQARQLLYQNI